MQPSLKSQVLFYINGLATLSGFHDIPQNLLIEYTTVTYYFKVLDQQLGQSHI